MGKSNPIAKIVVRPRQGVTPEMARTARARFWQSAFDAYERTIPAAVQGGRGADGTWTKGRSADGSIQPQS